MKTLTHALLGFCTAATLACAILVLSSISTPSTAHADICAPKTNLAPSPSAQLRSVSNGWLQWLNRSYTFTCTGTSTHLACSHSTELYSFDYLCDASHCYVEAYEGTTHWRDEAVMNTGDVWGWTWDAWKNGYLQISCTQQNPGSNITTCNYNTCD